MSKYFSILFFWSKGALVRRRLLIIISEAQDNNEPVFVSKVADLYNKKMKTSNKNNLLLTQSAIRKHIRFLMKYEILKTINPGGRPEYLELTGDGKESVNRIKSEKYKSKSDFLGI